jgi:superoxide dismutase, Fe-Mn family
MKYDLPPLTYGHHGLEPHLGARALELHHHGHHAAYVRRLNETLSGYPSLSRRPLEDMLRDIGTVPEEIRQAVRNLGGGHLNHCLFWDTMGPDGPRRPEGRLREAVRSEFGDFERFREEFTVSALQRLGSGWMWLCLDAHGALALLSTPNEDSPLMYGMRPVLGVDLWEHAYYLDYQDRRADYLASWWSVVDWRRAGEMYLLERALLASEA